MAISKAYKLGRDARTGKFKDMAAHPKKKKKKKKK